MKNGNKIPIYGKLDSTSLVKLYMLGRRGRKGKSLRNRWKKALLGRYPNRA
jgi:hypothetical protein